MKIHSVFMLCCLFVMASPSASFGEGTLHTFTTPDGRSLNATIKDYNSRTGKIQIKREDSKELWTLPTVFSEPDQEYIQQWIAADQFMSRTKFKIKGNSNKDTISKSKTTIEYEITLENRTDFPFKDLRVEYRAFILNQGYESYKDSNRVGGDQLLIAEIPTGGRVSQTTQPIRLTTRFRTVTEVDSYTGSTTTYEKKTTAERLKGFWVKVYGPVIDGTPTIREWCYPPDTSEDFAWQDVTQSNQRNSVSSTTRSSKKISNTLREAYRLQNSNPAKAIELFIKAYETDPDPKIAQKIGYTSIWRLKPPDIPLGLKWLEKAAEGNNVPACRLLALAYSTYYGYPEYYNLEKTLKYGQQALSIEPDCHTSHQAIAKAYAFGGQFDKAVEHQRIALELFKNAKGKPTPEHISNMEATLELYRNNKTE